MNCLSGQIIGTTSYENALTEALLSPPTGKRQDKLNIEMDGKSEICNSSSTMIFCKLANNCS